MKCPVCKKDEFSSEEMGDGLTALRCDDCQGHWLDRHPLRSRILAHLTASALCLALLVPSR